MRVQINEMIYIESDHVESANAQTLAIRMISGIEYVVRGEIFQSILEAMKNKDAISNVGAY